MANGILARSEHYAPAITLGDKDCVSNLRRATTHSVNVRHDCDDHAWLQTPHSHHRRLMAVHGP